MIIAIHDTNKKTYSIKIFFKGQFNFRLFWYNVYIKRELKILIIRLDIIKPYIPYFIPKNTPNENWAKVTTIFIKVISLVFFRNNNIGIWSIK